MKHWNYAWQASYFVTICTQNRICYFGDIMNGEMHLSEIGKIVKSEWMKSPHIRPDMNLVLGVCVVMPNLFHGIIFIGKNKYNQRDTIGRDAMHGVSTDTDSELTNQFGPQSKNLASVIRGFKSAVTIQVRQINPDFAWRHLFHDHIIRNDQSYHRIAEYIIDNSSNWKEDKFFEN